MKIRLKITLTNYVVHKKLCRKNTAYYKLISQHKVLCTYEHVCPKRGNLKAHENSERTKFDGGIRVYLLIMRRKPEK
jgi:hypothetical protein